MHSLHVCPVFLKFWWVHLLYIPDLPRLWLCFSLVSTQAVLYCRFVTIYHLWISNLIFKLYIVSRPRFVVLFYTWESKLLLLRWVWSHMYEEYQRVNGKQNNVYTIYINVTCASSRQPTGDRGMESRELCISAYFSLKINEHHGMGTPLFDYSPLCSFEITWSNRRWLRRVEIMVEVQIVNRGCRSEVRGNRMRERPRIKGLGRVG